MNCDRVFEVLTRGPFPTGTAIDAPVEEHLHLCSECRRLAEALRPALELFQESVAPEESRDLPGYWSAVAVDRVQPSVTQASQGTQAHYGSQAQGAKREPMLSAAHARSEVLLRHFSALAAWRLAAALALGVTLGSLVTSRGNLRNLGTWRLDRPSSAVIAPADEQFERRVQLTDRQFLASLPAACYRNRPVVAPRYRESSDRLLASARLDNLDCCTDCHFSGTALVSASTVAEISHRCQFCHTE